MYARISAWIVALALVLTAHATAQERFGTLQGRVTDQQSAPIPGVTVSVTSLTSGETRTFVTDANGQFVASDLNPGRYKVNFELSGFTRIERPDVSVALGRTFEVNTEMSVSGVTETVQVTAEASPLVDNRSTLIAHNVSAEEFDRLPKGRSFQSIALTAPSVNSGEVEGGFQVNGASGAENGFTVDGITTNSLINGQSRQNTVFEYLQEVQVKTSGISAEYGGALGGVISAVTKSGGNVFRGEGHYYYEGSALAVGPVKRLVLDPTTEATGFYVQDNENENRQSEFGGFDRRPDPQESPVLLRRLLAARREPRQSLQLHRRHQHLRQRNLAPAGVRKAHLLARAGDRQLVDAVDADQVRRQHLRLQRRDPQQDQHHAGLL